LIRQSRGYATSTAPTIAYLDGGRKRYIKIHFTVDINTKEVISMDVT
jgi:hypothetical protein